MRYIPDVGTVREFCTDFDRAAGQTVAAHLLWTLHPIPTPSSWHSVDVSSGFVRVRRLRISTKASSVCGFTVMQLNA